MGSIVIGYLFPDRGGAAGEARVSAAAPNRLPLDACPMKRLKSMVRKSLRSVGYDIVRYEDHGALMQWDCRYGLNVFGLVVDELLRSRPGQPLTLLQIGANDGVRQDPVRPVLAHPNVQGVLVEPIPSVHEKLRTNYAGFPNVRTANSAIGGADGTLTLYALDRRSFDDASLVASFDRRHVERFRRIWDMREDELVSHDVPCLTVQTILGHHGWKRVDIAVADTEGMDHLICNQLLDLDEPPEIIHFEYALSPEFEIRRILERLEQMNYAVARTGLDMTATRTMPVLA